MQITAIALGGMERAEARVDLAASRLSQATDPEAGGDTVALSQEIVSLLEARTDFQARVKVVQTAQEMERSLSAADMIDS